MNVLNCKYVGSRGLLMACDRKASIPISDFDGLNPSLYENIQEDNEVLHVCPQALNNFVTKVLPKLTKILEVAPYQEETVYNVLSWKKTNIGFPLSYINLNNGRSRSRW
jgi:hypothetical protein